MARLIKLKTFTDVRGSLTIAQNELPFPVRRVYYIYGADGHTRGGHRHHKTAQVLISVAGSCEIYVHDGRNEQTYDLDSPEKALLLDPQDWHTMKFREGAVLLCLASEHYDVADYIDEPYR